jgi:hypothetical protein
MDARQYIDREFEEMRSLGVRGEVKPALTAVFKMCFIAGMSAALTFPGDDAALIAALKPAMKAISEQYGGRTIFPL